MWIITQSLLVLAMGMQLTGCTTVRHQLGRVLISDETEYALGAQLAAHIDTTQTRLDNPNIQRYVERIAAPLVERAQVDRPGATYRFTVLDDPTQVNAFAVPGGFLYVYSGLIIAAEDEAELAGVLAHEIGHIVGRHSANQLASQFGIQLLSAIALGEEASKYAVDMAQITAQLSSARFSRDDERQADRYGLRYIAESGYDPTGLVRFFEKLGALEGGKRTSVETLFSSHPATEERIRDIEAKIERLGIATGQRNAQRYMRETAVLRR